jgi:carbohydrate kinase (thermoresistant glucokinase family)
MPELIAPRLMIVMGVSSCGKSSVASALAEKHEAIFLDADDYHPASNIEKMSRGDALNDEDRWPWLKHFANTMAYQKGLAIGACSSLKRVYREKLIEAAGEPILFIHLHGSRDLLEQRIAARENHFMPPSLLSSQLATLEIPDPDENAITIDITGSKEQVIQLIRQELKSTAEL